MSKKFSRFQMLIQNYLKSKYDLSSNPQFTSSAPLYQHSIMTLIEWIQLLFLQIDEYKWSRFSGRKGFSTRYKVCRFSWN